MFEACGTLGYEGNGRRREAWRGKISFLKVKTGKGFVQEKKEKAADSSSAVGNPENGRNMRIRIPRKRRSD